MKRAAYLLLCITLLVSLTACGASTQDGTAAGSRALDPNAGDYTIMVYMDGANLESEYGLASEDLGEMLAATLQNENVTVIVQTGGALKWTNESIPSDAIGRYLVTDDSLQLLETLEQQSMVDPATLTDFITYGYENYPAERYGLIMWDHGSGPLFGYGMDQNYEQQSTMRLNEIADALKASPAGSEPLEFLGFDSCLMATIEIAHALSPVAKYLVSSQELEPGQGWDYTAWLNSLNSNSEVDGLALGKTIVDSYMSFYQTHNMASASLTLSVVDLSKTQPVVDALEGLVAEADLSEAKLQQNVQRMRASIKSYGEEQNGGESHYDLIDMRDLSEHFSETAAEESAALSAALDQAVLYSAKGQYVDIAGGLSLYFPYEELDYIEQDLELYAATGFSQVYVDYISSFVDTLGSDNAQVPMDSVADQVPARGGSEQERSETYSIDLSPEQFDNIQNGSLHLYQKQEDGSYLHVYKDMVVDFDSESGRAQINFSGEIITINGQVACMYESYKGDGYTLYDVPAVLNGANVDVQVLFNDGSQTGSIVGAVPVYEDSRSSSRQILPLKEGDMLALSYSTAMLGGEHAGHNHNMATWVSGDEQSVGAEVAVERSAPPAGTYLAGFCFCDLQGNSHDTQFIELVF